MIQFECTVYDQHGIRQVVTINSTTEEAAKRKLVEAGYSVAKVVEISEKKGTSLFAKNRLTLEQLEFFSAQMSLLLGNGLKLDEALELLQKVAVEKNIKFVVGKMLNQVREGHPLSGALESRWGFDKLYVSLVQIGESSGNISDVFAGIAADLKFKKALAGKVKQAVSYPILVLVFCTLAILFVFNVVIPRMSVLFENQENLPWYTEVMLASANFVTTYQWLMLPLVVAIPALLIQLKRRPELKASIDTALIHIPMVSQLIRMLERIRYSSAMFLTIKSGISVERAMQYSAKVIKNIVLQRQAEAAEMKVRQGNALASSFKQTLIYDEIHTGLIEVGERSGDLESIFKEITEREQFNFDALVTRFTALLEPALIMLMAGIVGSVVVVMLMSIIAVQDIGF
ncbi:type II secretion system F family protein [Alteromonas sp. a30]|uniref:type II secretion system F family protein n=1 Tax=Alteromonas sp. a30 TaxID=2730917 RepID=UPI00228278F9|nr:type II secretion system F family protein [Alteromonas sp. a30]MCY7294380.1 type II secretion system F family protein [Alteromonas sp. a30]